MRDHWTEASPERPIQETDFTVELDEPKINRDGLLYQMRVDAARSLEVLHVTWVDGQGEEHERQIEASQSDLKEKYSGFMSVLVLLIDRDCGDCSRCNQTD
jgi:uncharacterized Fe-S center protein